MCCQNYPSRYGGVHCKIDDTEYTIKERWSELTVAEYLVIASDLKPIEKLSKFTGIPVEKVESLSCGQLAVMFGAMAWSDDYNDGLLFVRSLESKVNIGKSTYGNLEKAKLSLQKYSQRPMLSVVELVKIYEGEDISELPFIENIGRGIAILEKINTFLSGFKELYEYEPTPEEIEAGVEDLNKLGSFYTVKKLSEKFGKHPDEILNWEAAIVYSFLKADAIDARISQNLQKIYQRKK